MSKMSFEDGYKHIWGYVDLFRGILNASELRVVLYLIHAFRVGLLKDSTDIQRESVLSIPYESDLMNAFQSELIQLGHDHSGALRTFLNRLSNIEPEWFEQYEAELFDAILSTVAGFAGKASGEFTQPYELTRFVSAISGYDGKGVMYNPYAGSASYCTELSGSGQFVGQELSRSAWGIGVLRLLAHKKDPSTFLLGNSISEWQGVSEHSNNGRRFDLIVATPPISMPLRDEHLSMFGKKYPFAEDLFIEDSLQSLTPNGIAIGVFAQGLLFRGNAEAELRKSIVENDKLDSIISLPAGVFQYTSIPTVILKFSNKKERPGYVRIVNGESFFERKRTRQVILYDQILSAIERDDPNYVKYISTEEIREQNYILAPKRYFQKEIEVPEGFIQIPISDLLEVVRGERVATEDTQGVFVNIASLSSNPFSYQLDKMAASEPLNSQYRKITTPVVLVSKIRDLKPTFAQASEDEPIFIHPNVLALKVIDDSKVFIPCLILELSKASSDIPKAGVIPSMPQSDILKHKLIMPEGKSLQEAFYLNAEKEHKEAQIRELGLEGIIRSQKAEYETLIRRRKHDLNNMLGDARNSIDAISAFLDSKGYSGEIMDDDLNVSLGQILSHIQTSLSSMSGVIRHLDDDEKYAEPEVLDLVPRLKALANEVHRNFSVRFSADSYSLCDVVQDDDELHAWVKFGSDNLDRVFFNIIQNAEKHGFVDPSRTDYAIEIELTHDYESACFVIRFKNNGKPLPSGMNTRRYGTRAESAGTTAGSGDGGAIIKSTIEHYGGTVELISRPDDWFPVCIEIKIPHYGE